jgi:hypothetical protein
MRDRTGHKREKSMLTEKRRTMGLAFWFLRCSLDASWYSLVNVFGGGGAVILAKVARARPGITYQQIGRRQ